MNSLLKTGIALLALGQCALPVCAQQRMDQMWGEQQAKQTDTTTQRGHRFEWGNYAMFIHWGLFSHLANKWHGRTHRPRI